MDLDLNIPLDDEQSLSDAERKDLVIKYIEFIGKNGFTVVKCVAKKEEYLYSLRTLVKFTHNDREVFGFYAPIKFSEFSLLHFKKEVVNGTNQTRMDFGRAIKARIVPYTTEEVICALLSDDYNMKIEDIYKNNTLVIPPSRFDRLFEVFNLKAGNLKNRVMTK